MFEQHDLNEKKNAEDVALTSYPIGTPGVAWGAAERAQWLCATTQAPQLRRRRRDSHRATRARFDVEEYGQLDYPPDHYRQLALRSRDGATSALGARHGRRARLRDERRARRAAVPRATRGGLSNQPARGALRESLGLRAHSSLERECRRSEPLVQGRQPAAESAALLRLVAPLRGRFLLHVDLHETTDSDESEFRPALAARDGKPFEPGLIPDGFYLVDDSENPQPEFQRAIIEAVAKVTHIAPADDKNEIIGSPVVAPGVIEYPLRQLGLCAGITGARYTTTTEVYPDSPRATPEQCNAAQVAAVCAAIEFVLRKN